MQATEQATLTDPARIWRRVLADLSVTYVWAYDTVAILDDYYDSQPGILPSGQLIMFSAVADDPQHFICDLDDPRFIERRQLPRGRMFRFRPWSFTTRLQAVVATSDFHALTAATARPSWFQRLLRFVRHQIRKWPQRLTMRCSERARLSRPVLPPPPFRPPCTGRATRARR